MFNSEGGLEVTPTISNSILWDNTPDQIVDDYAQPGSSTTIGYSDVQGGCDTIPGNDCGDGNIDADPLFVDADTGDLRLQLTSPAIDAGDNRALPLEITTDLGGQPRFVDIPSVVDTGIVDDRDAVDMGAYEAQYFTLSVTKAGTGSGTVTSDPPGIDCGTDCTEDLFQATVITLTAVADTGSIFDSWSGACTGSGECAVTMDSAQVVTGTFTLDDTGHEVYLPVIMRGTP
jgi:hypothetical protein